MLHALRQDLGSEAFWSILRGYAETNSGRVATPGAFWAQFTEAQLEITAVTRGLYLRRPQVN
jgi:aminopeptidase N